MKNINNYINELLQQHDFVALPNFGGFVASYNSAIINVSNGLVQPPYKNIVFNKNLTHNDGLLAHYIIEQTQCTMPQALVAIEEYVQHINTSIATHKRVELPQLGVFYVNAENTLLFRQNKAQDFSLASYGLPSFTVNKLQPKTIPVTITNIIELPIQTHQPEAVVRKINYGRIAAAAITIPALIGLIWTSMHISQLQNINNAGFTTTTTPPATTTTNAPLYDRAYFEKRMAVAEKNITQCKHTIDSLSHIIALKTQADTTRVSTMSVAVIQQNSFAKYYLIAGCFSSVDNANNYVNELKQQGYTSATIINGQLNGLTRVAYGVYTSKQDAQQSKMQVAATNAGAWIFKTMN